MKLLRGWRPPLRLAWRDAWRSKGRSVLVLVMIALPVLAVTAADVVISTSSVSGAEALDRRLGSADARVQFEGTGSVVQFFDPDDGSGMSGGRSKTSASLATVSDVLGRDVWGVEIRQGTVRFTTDKGIGEAEATEVDLADPLAKGLFELEQGALPAADGQVVINSALADRGFVVGDGLEVVDGPTVEIVGVVESTSHTGYPIAVGPMGSLGVARERGRGTFLVDAGPVPWSEVRALNDVGAFVLSREVLLDPPPESALPAELQGLQGSTGNDDAVIAVIVLVVVMALLEVVLLAGPAFAVGARRQSRTLALMAATGGTPQQARRVVLAGGLVLGGLAAAGGVLLGIGAAAALLPVVQNFSDSRFGPFDVPWPHLVGIALFGLASAFLAAVVPAWIASRQDVVAVLAGRRGDRPPSLRSPILGVLLLGAGVAGSVYGARSTAQGEFLIAGSAVVAVLGMIFLVPVVVVGLARLSRALPLVFRYAVRDAARHRTRTVPAVAAVAATVAGVVALGIANASDAKESEATYTPMLEMGQASVQSWDGQPQVWDRFHEILDREAPGAVVTELRGIAESRDDGGFTDVALRTGRKEVLLDSWSGALSSSVLVSDDEIPLAWPGLDDERRAAAEQVLAAGGAVVLTSRAVDADEVSLKSREYGPTTGRAKVLGRATVPAYYLEVGNDVVPVRAVLSTPAAEAIGVQVSPVALIVDGGVTPEQEKDVSEAISAVSENASFYVERGYQKDDETVILLLVLGALGGVLMLGGTLTATFLALSDARPDLATLSAVGAAPRTRRGVASAYALVVGAVGAMLGAGVGFIPGIAITYPLTGGFIGPSGVDVPHYLDIPWLLILTLVVALPLLTAAIVGLTARSRLPLVARLG